MCGIAGFLNSPTATTFETAQQMAEKLHHRGPDDFGIWQNNDIGLSLIHTRLSVLDLSPAAHQPMHSPNGRYTIVFNGEIYNHLDLRNELSIAWKSHSDTETLLAAFEAWGVEKTLQKTVGMFAIALWDNHKQQLYLARDRMGEKPLYYGFQNSVFMFASELKALKTHPYFEEKIDRNAIALQMRHNYIPHPWSIYQGIHKLQPGTYATIQPNSTNVTITPYWKLHDHIQLDMPVSADQAINSLDALLKKTIRDQMLSDVPLGAFLSGGIDSSLVTALMQTQSSSRIKTFTIGFDQPGYNEAEFAKAVAQYLGTEHTELYVTDQDALNVIPRLSTLYDEPFSDSSQIPTFLVSQMTKQHVTVALSGDGADELFGGYNRYLWAESLWNRFKNIPLPIRHGMHSLITQTSAEKLNTFFESLALLPKKLRYNNIGDKLHKLASILPSTSREMLYLNLISNNNQPQQFIIGADEPLCAFQHLQDVNQLDFISQMMYADAMGYLPGDILTKVDRASMGVSLETRAPFLDHRVVEAAWTLPLSLKIHEGQSKWILRQILYKYVPKELIERPKMGFGAPIGIWLRGPLREWAEELLNEDRLRREGFFYPQPIRQKWEEHLSGKRNWQYQLWDILMFQSWLEKQ